MSLTSKIQALIAYANETTGKSDTSLGEAVRTLADGYGHGGGQMSRLGYNGHINTSQLLAQGWTQAQVERLVSMIWWNEEEDEWYNSRISKFYHWTATTRPPTDAIAVVWDVASLPRMDYLLRNYYALCYFDATDVGTWGAYWFSQAFTNCSSLRAAIINPVTVSTPLSTFQSAFNACAQLRYLKIGTGVSISNNNPDFVSALNGCLSLEYLEWTPSGNMVATSAATSMFNNCTNLRVIDLDSMGLSVAPANASNMFAYCYNLREVKGVVDITNSSYCPINMYNRCLEEIRIKGLKVAANLTDCPLSHDSLVYLLTNLQTVSGLKLTLGTANLAKLSDSEKQLATSKGWTLA